MSDSDSDSSFDEDYIPEGESCVTDYYIFLVLKVLLLSSMVFSCYFINALLFKCVLSEKLLIMPFLCGAT